MWFMAQRSALLCFSCPLKSLKIHGFIKIAPANYFWCTYPINMIRGFFPLSRSPFKIAQPFFVVNALYFVCIKLSCCLMAIVRNFFLKNNLLLIFCFSHLCCSLCTNISIRFLLYCRTGVASVQLVWQQTYSVQEEHWQSTRGSKFICSQKGSRCFAVFNGWRRRRTF